MSVPLLGGRVRSHWRALLLGALIGAVGAGTLAAIVLPPMLLAHRSNWPGEQLVAKFAFSAAAKLHAPGSVSAPLTDRAAIERGRTAYIGSCAQCHGTHGDGKDGAFSKTLFPPATDFTSEDAREKSDAELFWATKNGLSFTAMPAFSGQYNDDTIRAIVAYVRQLQQGGAAAQSLVIPTPSAEQLSKADPTGDSVARGAAVYFAADCQSCHGAAGEAPGDLRLRELGSDSLISCQVRNGPNGMPAYNASTVSDAQMADLIAYMRAVAPADQPREGFRPPEGGSPRPSGTPRASGTPGARPPEGGFEGGGRDAYSSPAASAPGFVACGR